MAVHCGVPVVCAVEDRVRIARGEVQLGQLGVGPVRLLTGDGVESEVESFDLGQARTLAEEIEDLATESAIEDELAALRNRLAKKRDRTEGA